jgi:hypothetical protein
MLFGYVSAYNCSDAVVDCSGRGVCLPNTECLCNDGYITWPKDNVYQCNYKQTKKLGPFLCQFFIGIATGCGAFMLGEYTYAVSELLLFVILVFTLCSICCCFMHSDSEHVSKHVEYITVCLHCTVMLSVLIIFALWLSVIIFISVGGFTDKNGAPLGEF